MAHLKLALITVTLSFVALCYGQANLDAIECPFPGGSDQSNEASCSQYSACDWTGTRCRMKSNAEVGYTVVSGPVDTGRGFTAQLRIIDPFNTLYEEDIMNLQFEVIYHQDYHVQIKITDSDATRYEPPVPLNLPATAGDSPMYQVTVSDVGTPFSFAVTRTSNGNTLYNMIGPLIYENQFIQLTTSLMSSYLYGLGESTHTSLKRNFDSRDTCAMFARDQSLETALKNLYGTHPYYTLVEDGEGNSHSVFLFNSNAMEYSTFSLDDGTPALTLRTIGGIIDMHFFLGPTPEDVNTQYINTIGRPAFHPYTAFGFHLSRWGYASTDEVREVRQRMKDNGIPQDVQTFDIDYMYNYRDFTVDPVNWADFPQLIQELHDDNVKVTVILDPSVVIDIDNYPTVVRGLEADAFVKWSDPAYIPSDQPSFCGDFVVGYCWPDNKTLYPDFFKPEAQDWWINELVLLHETVDFDFMWIDMNEPAVFGTDMDKPWNYPEGFENWSLKCPYNKYDSPPYPTATTHSGYSDSGRISDHSLCLSTKQTDNVNTYLGYDVHSLYGWSMAIPTFRGMNTIYPGQRQLVLTRSTYPGSGVYASHWLGDNVSAWEQMAMSVIGMIEFSMFGMPFAGADVCGFLNDSDEELCTRWTQLGAFSPFNRNHNAQGNIPQDPGVWPTTAAVARDYFLLRYKFNPYLYSLFHEAHMYGSSVIRPLYNVFPADLTARDVDDQFMWADGLMVAPVLVPGATSRDVYFPEGKWFNLVDGSLQATGPQTSLVAAPLEEIPVYVRGGKILQFQEPALTLTDSRVNPFGLVVAIGDNAASGEIYWDDGITDMDMANAFLATLSYDTNTFTMTVDNPSPYVTDLTMDTITFYGYESEPTSITVNGVDIGTSWDYNTATQVLTVTLTDIPLGGDLTVLLA